MYSPLLRRIGAASLCVLAACQSERSVAPTEEAAVNAVAPATASLSTALTGTSISLAVPDTVQLTVRNTTIKRSRSIAWRSSNTAVAGVTSSGQVFARSAGTTTITASASGRSETTPVLVINQQVTLATNPASLSLSLGARATIVASSSTATGTMLRYRSYGYSSKNPAVASVDAEGVVTAAASGATEIVVTDGTSALTVPVSVAGGSADAASVVDFQLTPPSTSLAKGAKRQFATQTIWSDGVSRPVAVTYTATGGTITVGGMYTAGQVVGTFAVIATCACGRADTSLVSVTSVSGQQPTLSSLVMTPSAVTLAPSVKQQFNVTALWSDGGTNLPTLIYTASGGTVRSDGQYTAPAVAGTYRLIVSGGGKADTSAITVVSATPTLSSLTISPKTLSLAPGGSHQFSASALWSNGGTTLPSVTYTALGGGSIAEGTWFNAPTTAGTYRVIVNGGGKADTATVTVTSASSTLTSLQISPATVTLAPSATYQFSTTALWSNGSTALPTRTYTATGGSVNATGFYTAPSSAGTYRVIVASGAKADTSVVTVSATAPTPTLTSISITPGSVTLAPSASYQFGTSAVWSNGSTTLPAVTYSTTGGSVSSTGAYVAAATTGTYRVIVRDASGAHADTSVVTVATVSTPPTPIGNPSPSASSTILLDTRAGGAHSIQDGSVQTITDALNKLKLGTGGQPVETRGSWSIVPNFNGRGTKAFRLDMVGWCDRPDLNYVCTMKDAGGTLIPTLVGKPKEIFIQWKHWMGRTPTGGGADVVDANGVNRSSVIGRFAVTNDDLVPSNASRKYLLLLRDVADKGGYGRIDMIWNGQWTTVAGTPRPVALQAYNSNILPFPGYVGPNRAPFDIKAAVNTEMIFTAYFKAASAVGVNDGICRVWINGVLISEKTDFGIEDLGFDRFEFPATMNSPRYTQTEYFWDLVVWKP